MLNFELKYIIAIICVIICSIIIYLYNSFRIYKFMLLDYTFNYDAYIPVVRKFLLGKIIEKNVNCKFIGKYTKFIFMIMPLCLFLYIPGLCLFALFYLYYIYCNIMFVKTISPGILNYILVVLLPGIAYKKCYEKMLLNSKD